jgi:glycosyltransferase involved in cell wall biosynthesis
MASRKRIALTYYYSKYWIAGSYYVANLISALKSLDDEVKPHLVILHHKGDHLKLIEDVKYPHISYIDTDINSGGILDRIVKKFRNRMNSNKIFYKKSLKGIEHVFEGNDDLNFIKNRYYWVHDFQQYRLPEYFSKEDADNRSALPKKVAEMKNATLILSSYDALNDFNTYFPSHKCKVNVWQFTSTLPDFSSENLEQLCQKFNIQTPYFICANQFWQHKNHMAILEAIYLLKTKNYHFQVVFTGQNFDFRNPKYFEGLQEYIEKNKLEPWVNIVGFIDRNLQLCLAANAICYIQPSYFEGWSTSVEDAKCLNQFVLLSDIPVHREQLNYNVSFFNPSDPGDLSVKMEAVLKGEVAREMRDYSRNILKFGNDIMKTFLKNEE